MNKSIIKHTLWFFPNLCMGFQNFFQKKKFSKKIIQKIQENVYINPSLNIPYVFFQLYAWDFQNFFPKKNFKKKIKKKIKKIQENVCMNFSSHFPMHKKITQLFSMIFLCMGFLKFFKKKKSKKIQENVFMNFSLHFPMHGNFPKKKM